MKFRKILILYTQKHWKPNKTFTITVNNIKVWQKFTTFHLYKYISESRHKMLTWTNIILLKSNKKSNTKSMWMMLYEFNTHLFWNFKQRVIHIMHNGDALISLFQFQYDINTIFTKYCDIDIKYVSKIHTFCRLKF